MTKKDFQALAEALRESRPVRITGENDYGERRTQWEASRERIIIACYASNSRFKRDRFIEWTEK